MSSFPNKKKCCTNFCFHISCAVASFEVSLSQVEGCDPPLHVKAFKEHFKALSDGSW